MKRDARITILKSEVEKGRRRVRDSHLRSCLFRKAGQAFASAYGLYPAIILIEAEALIRAAKFKPPC